MTIMYSHMYYDDSGTVISVGSLPTQQYHYYDHIGMSSLSDITPYVTT